MQEAHHAFLSRCGGWAVAASLTPDCGHRRYWRVAQGGRRAILVEDGQTLAPFVRVAAALRAHGFAAPEVYEAAAPFALLEDFGATALRALPQGEALPLAIDAARALAACGGLLGALDLPAWVGHRLQQKRMNFVLDYLGQDDTTAFEAAWREAEGALPPVPEVFVHADFHPDNLMRLLSGRVGLLDFQDALAGPAAYDVANLLEDARADVPPDLRAAMLERYCAGMGPGEREAFDGWYRVLGTEFHCRVLGLFTRLGGPYAAHIPRLHAYIRDALPHPVLAPVSRWFSDAGIALAT